MLANTAPRPLKGEQDSAIFNHYTTVCKVFAKAAARADFRIGVLRSKIFLAKTQREMRLWP